MADTTADTTPYRSSALDPRTHAAIDRDRDFSPEGRGPDIVDAATLKGDRVTNPEGQDLGSIEAIMIDIRNGRIAYAVLSFGGFLGMGSKLFAIPWSVLSAHADGRNFVLPVSRERLEGAPGFDKDHWPSMADRAWADELHSYYDAPPYWGDDPLSASSG
jgi:hypothetical protein